jgi:hypothetical protein
MLVSIWISAVFCAWMFSFSIWSKHVTAESYKVLTWEEYLEMPWGPAFGPKTAEEAMDSMSPSELRMMRQMYKGHSTNVAKIKADMDRYIKEEESLFAKTAIRANVLFTDLSESIGTALKPNWVDEWINSPIRDFDRLAHPFSHVRVLRMRFFSFAVVGAIIAGLLALTWCLHKKPDEHKTVVELLFSTAGVVRLLVIMLLLSLGAQAPIMTLFIGPPWKIIPFLFAPLSGVLLYLTTFKGRELV